MTLNTRLLVTKHYPFTKISYKSTLWQLKIRRHSVIYSQVELRFISLTVLFSLRGSYQNGVMNQYLQGTSLYFSIYFLVILCNYFILNIRPSVLNCSTRVLGINLSTHVSSLFLDTYLDIRTSTFCESNLHMV